MSGFIFEHHSVYCTIRYTPDLAELDWSAVEQATHKVSEQLKEAPTDSLLIDLSSLKQLPAGLLASLMQTWQDLDNRQTRFVVVTSDDRVQQSLDSASLIPLWQIAQSLSEGYATLGVSEQSDSGNVVSAKAPMLFEDLKGYCSVQLDPELMSMSWSEVEAATSQVITQLKSSKNNSVMVDLGPMDYINSGLIASLVRVWKTMKERNGQFSLVSPNEAVTDVLKTAGLWKLWSVVDRREEAVYDLGASTAAIAENRERRLLTLVSVSCAAIAALALAMMFGRREADGAVNSQLAALLLAAAALTTGLIAVFKESGTRRILAAFAVIVAMGVLSTLWFKDSPIWIGQPQSATTPQPAPNDASQSSPEAATSDTTESNGGSAQTPHTPTDDNPSIDPLSSEATQ